MTFFLNRRILAVSLIAVALSAACAGAAPEPPKGRNVILVILDTLRADHLSCYGYSRETSPAIDSLAAAGTIWLSAYAQAPWTLPSHASIWTGLSVRAHGTNRIGGIQGFDMQLDTQLPSLPQMAQGAGYTTAGFVNFVLLSSEFGFDAGFDYYDCENSGTRTAQSTLDTFMLWLDEHGRENSFVAVIHLYDIHAPYSPVSPYDTVFGSNEASDVINWDLSEQGEILNPEQYHHLLAMYDGEILYTDTQLQRLFRNLRSQGIADSTLVIITSDHGEEFFEHGGIGHGHALYQEQIHVPLIMSGPGIDAGVGITAPVALIDIMPAVLSYLGVETPEGVEGIDIITESPENRPIPSGGISPDRFFLATTDLGDFQSCAVIHGSDKIIAYMEQDSLMQFSLTDDPAEQNPLPADSAMTERAYYYWATPRIGNPEPTGEMTDEINATLRDLGYIR